MNTQYVKIYTESDGVFEVSFTKYVNDKGNGKSRRITKIGYYFWLVLFLYILICSVVFFATLNKQGTSPYVNISVTVALMDLGFVFFPITDYWNIILKSNYLISFVVVILSVTTWRYLKTRSDLRSMEANDDLMSCYREYDAGNYKHAIHFLNKLRDRSGLLEQELTGNLAYLYYKQGDVRKAESVLLSVYDKGAVIKAKNIRVVAE